jgi:rubredoxin
MPMTREQMLESLAQMMQKVEVLGREDDPVLRSEMPRIMAILHEARQLLDPQYDRLITRPLGEAIEKDMQYHYCTRCGYIYDAKIGDPQSGIAPGTAWKDVPSDWHCPDCGAVKTEFEGE